MQEWKEFRLNDPGMGPYHRAGLAGLTASLVMLGKWNALPAALDSFEYDEQKLSMSGFQPTAESLHSLLQAVYRLNDDGLFDFPVLESWGPFQKAELQKLYLGSFLQHPSARKAEGKQKEKNSPLDEKKLEYSYLPLRDFIHRDQATCQRIAEAVAKQKSMDIAGWALPGGIVKHNAVQETGLKESPEKFFLLLFAPLGCLFFQGHAGLSNGERDKRTQTLVAVPRPRQLRSFVDLLLRFYERTGSERASGKVPLIRVQGVKEAALQAAMLLHLQNTPKLRRLSCDFTVVRFGTVSWSAQQKTRTALFSSTCLSEETVQKYQIAHDKLHRAGKGTHFVYCPFLGQIADNLVLGNDEWYRGISVYMTDERRKSMIYWQRRLGELVQEKMIWKEQSRREFVGLMHSAIRNRFGKVSNEAKHAGGDLSTFFKREYERMRQLFVNCRTQEKFRENLMDFVTRTRPSVPADSTRSENELLLLACEADWREGKDLCLLALASYRGKETEKYLDQGEE